MSSSAKTQDALHPLNVRYHMYFIWQMKQVVNTSASIVMLKVSIIDNLVLKYNDRLRRKRVNTTLFFAN